MKKIILILVIFVFSLGVKAQRDSLKVNFGLMLNPQGMISLNSPASGFSVSIPLFVILPLEKGDWSLTPIYSLTDNALGGFINYSFPKFGAYIVGIKSMQTANLYLGIGAGVPVADKRANAFIELGTLKDKFDPLLFIGLSIPFTLK